MTDLERRIKAKLPGEDTGIEIRRSMCDICSPGMHCGIAAYVKDGRVIKIEGLDGHPVNQGRLCTKGLSNRQFLYREDRILTPLRRIGKRGEGKFEPITWNEAYEEISDKLNAVMTFAENASRCLAHCRISFGKDIVKRFAFGKAVFENFGL